MKTALLLGLACAALTVAPALAQSDSTTTTVQNPDGSTTTTTRDVRKDNTGTVGGAAGGALAGAVVAGPIGAVVGGIAGATIGHSVDPPKEVRTYVTTQTAPPLAYQGQVEMGRPVTGQVAWRDVPSYPRYHWARLNDERVVVDDSHKVVAIYTD